MAKPRIPNQKKQYQLLNRRLAAYMAAVRRIYGELNGEAARIALSTGYDGKQPFAWKDYPATKARVRKLQERFVSQLGGLIMTGTSDEWKRSNLQQDLIVDKVLKAYHTSREDAANERYYRDNSEALQAFQQRKEHGMNLSDKLWDQSQAYREELQDTISAAIERGTDAITLSKQISKYLSDFPAMQRDYKEKYGKASKVQNCEYRSIRLARSEINMAYRSAEQQRWRQLDFVVGYEIKMSGSHPVHDVCDELAGKYPKDFKWNGWHPNCYTDKAMVLTNNGWKHFSDVESTDAILSLNPDTRDVEWVKFVARQCYPYSGKMIRFFNKSLECVVTPEHQMVYLSKTRGDIRKMSAIYYRKGNGAFYRTCEHRNQEEKQSIEINGDVWSFDDYCEFMGYWLADGSTQHTTGVALCQKKGEPAWDGMISCLERLGYHYTINEETISFYRSNIVRYLKQFGNAYNKFIPVEILSASKRQMQIFLDAFVKCDGYTRKTKSFVGNRGNVFSSKNDERMYFTTSPHLAGDLCQLLIMLGKRPSFKIKEPVTITKKDGSIIKGNYPCFVISECLSGTATVFDKEMVDYSGNVYDLTLEKNHIMYISYDGKCFWGSNCMCYEVPILKTEDEFYGESDKVEPEVKGKVDSEKVESELDGKPFMFETSEVFKYELHPEDRDAVESFANRLGQFNPLGEVKSFSIDDVVQTQQYVGTKNVIQIAQSIEKDGLRDNPTGIKVGDKVFIVDGHNRIAAMRLGGSNTFDIRVVEVSEEEWKAAGGQVPAGGFESKQRIGSTSINEVHDVPQEFKDWCTENWQRIEMARKHDTLPYFLDDNNRYVKENLTIERATEVRHAKRDEGAILQMLDNRNIMRSSNKYNGYSYYQRYLDVVSQCRYYGIDYTEIEEYIRTDKVNLKKLNEILDRLDDKAFDEYNLRLSYKERWGKVLQELRSSGVYAFSMDDVQDVIVRFETEHPLAGGTIPVGANAPKVATYREFANRIEREVKERRSELVQENQKKIEKTLSIERGKPMTHKEADTGRPNPNYDKTSYEWDHNCQCCVVTYEMRRRGYDVTAAARAVDNDYQNSLAHNSGYAYLDALTGDKVNPHDVHFRTSESAVDYAKRLLADMSDVGRYEVSISWNEEEGHIFSFERKANGTILVYDPQNDRGDRSTVGDTKELLLLLEYIQKCDRRFGLQVLRVDDKLINPLYIKYFVKGV